MLVRRVASVLTFGLVVWAIGCQTYTLKNPYIPEKAVDSTGPKYVHNVSQIQYWDRISTADQATGFAWWDSTGATRQVTEYWNKVIVLNFFGTWSQPCSAQLDEIQKFIHDQHDTNVVFIGVTQREALTAGKAVVYVDSFARAHDIDYQLLIGSRDFGFTYGGIDVVPTTFVIDRKRRIVSTFEGQVMESTLAAAVAKAEAR